MLSEQFYFEIALVPFVPEKTKRRYVLSLQLSILSARFEPVVSLCGGMRESGKDWRGSDIHFVGGQL